MLALAALGDAHRIDMQAKDLEPPPLRGASEVRWVRDLLRWRATLCHSEGTETAIAGADIAPDHRPTGLTDSAQAGL